MRFLKLRTVYAFLALQGLATTTYTKECNPAMHRFVRDSGALMQEVLNDLTAMDVDSSSRGAEIAWANLTATWDLCFRQAPFV